MHPPTMAAAVVPRPPWCLTFGAATYDNQPTFCATVACVGDGSGAPWRPLSVSTDVVGLLWVVSYIGICRLVYQTIGDASPMEEQHHSCRLGSLHAEWVVVPRPPIRYIMGE